MFLTISFASDLVSASTHKQWPLTVWGSENAGRAPDWRLSGLEKTPQKNTWIFRENKICKLKNYFTNLISDLQLWQKINVNFMFTHLTVFLPRNQCVICMMDFSGVGRVHIWPSLFIITFTNIWFLFKEQNIFYNRYSTF